MLVAGLLYVGRCSWKKVLPPGRFEAIQQLINEFFCDIFSATPWANKKSLPSDQQNAVVNKRVNFMTITNIFVNLSIFCDSAKVLWCSSKFFVCFWIRGDFTR
jgi:hypothetical protein